MRSGCHSVRLLEGPVQFGRINFDHRKHLLESHTVAEDCGRVAEAAGVKTLVLSHFVPGDGSIPDEEWRRAAAQSFKGQIIVGHDLLEI